MADHTGRVHGDSLLIHAAVVRGRSGLNAAQAETVPIDIPSMVLAGAPDHHNSMVVSTGHTENVLVDDADDDKSGFTRSNIPYECSRH
jgi:hypothetical protein